MHKRLRKDRKRDRKERREREKEEAKEKEKKDKDAHTRILKYPNLKSRYSSHNKHQYRPTAISHTCKTPQDEQERERKRKQVAE